MTYAIEQFPNKEAFLIGTSIGAVNKAFRDAHNKYDFIEAFANEMNSVGAWKNDACADEAQRIVNKEKKLTHNLVYMSFDKSGLNFLKQVVVGEFNNLPEGVTMDITLPETSNDMIVVTLNFS